MTRPLSLGTFERWVTTHTEKGQTEFTVSDLKAGVDLLFKGRKVFSLRSLYDICRDYVQIVGVPVQRRPRRNFNELVFTAGQITALLLAIDRQLSTRLSYVEVFVQMRDARQGSPSPVQADAASGLPESSASPPSVAELEAQVHALQEEITELRRTVQDLSGASLTKDDLWRLLVGVLTLSSPDNGHQAEQVMRYLGVSDLQREEMHMREAGVDSIFTD